MRERDFHREPPASESLDRWIAELSAALGVEPEAIDRQLVLDLSRTAHGLPRGAAPITVFLAGLAAGLAGGGAQAVAHAAATAQRVAEAFARPGERRR